MSDIISLQHKDECLWTSEEMVEAMGGRPFGDLPEGVSGISIDTRTLKPGDAFFAIKGDRFDGHNYVTAAMTAGASLIVVNEAKLPALGRQQIPMIVVDEALLGLERLGRAARQRMQGKVIAITGSVGKTTTKAMLSNALKPSGKVHSSVKSYNNHWGVPLTLARMARDAEFGIFEIGMSAAGEIRTLVDMVQPDLALITLIAPAHLGQFKGLDDIAHAKGEIFEGLVEGGTALLNHDDDKYKLLEGLAKKAGVQHIEGYGEHAKLDYRIIDCELSGQSSELRLKIGNEKHEFILPVPGRHMAQNALAVLAACDCLGANIAEAVMRLRVAQGQDGRGVHTRFMHNNGGEFTLIDESFNANPTSMKAALDVLKNISCKGKKIAVLGDMLELGIHATKLHGELVKPVVDAGVNQVFLVGEKMKTLADNLPDSIEIDHRKDKTGLEELALKAIEPGDVVMVKSSKGIGLSTLVDHIAASYNLKQ